MTTWTDDQQRLREGLQPLLGKISEGHVERDAEAVFPGSSGTCCARRESLACL